MLFKKNMLLVLVISLLLILVLPVFGEQAEQITLDMAVHSTEVYQKSADIFVNFVESVSGGRVKVITYPWPTLGSQTEIAEMISIGEIDMANAFGSGALSQTAPSIQALNIPFLIQSNGVLQKLMDGPMFYRIQDVVLKESGNTLRILSLAQQSKRHLYTVNGPIRTPEDLKKFNVKMRVSESPFLFALWGGLGTTPVVTSPGDRYLAFQSGMMDGVDGSPASVYGAGLMDFAKYVTLTGHTFVAAGFVINEERFQSFPIDIQDIIVEGAQLAEITDNGWVPLSELEALETMRDEGAVITIPTSEEYEQWREIAYKIGMEHIEGSVKDKALIQELMEEVERVEKELKEERARIAGRLQ